MKTCDVKHCPLCGFPTDWPGKHAGISCENEYADNGWLVQARIYWTCQRCGCKWLDGQYADTDKR